MENKTISNVLELRIDNLVYNKHMEVHRFSYMDFMNYRLPSMGGNYGFSSIPLTEEWLLRLSFVKWGNSNTYGNGKIIIHKRKRGWVINTKVPIIESVHQLMNYSFYVTGQELTIK